MLFRHCVKAFLSVAKIVVLTCPDKIGTVFALVAEQPCQRHPPFGQIMCANGRQDDIGNKRSMRVHDAGKRNATPTLAAARSIDVCLRARQ